MSMRDLAEEFIALRIPPLGANWPIVLPQASEGDLRNIAAPLALAPEDIVRVTERVLGAPSVAERQRRLELVGSWERSNRVWRALRMEPPNLPDFAPTGAVVPKRKATAEPSKKTGKQPPRKKKIAKHPSQLAPSSSASSPGAQSSASEEAEDSDGQTVVAFEAYLLDDEDIGEVPPSAPVREVVSATPPVLPAPAVVQPSAEASANKAATSCFANPFDSCSTNRPTGFVMPFEH
ncbi:hypothetical protein GUJ93_ZPchr0010g10678 [Zizania palustris]|uniref:Uncharacterized protein n=1 Tax=Zizania palustris TaxID=103762 RepID=A0A8J5WGJ4_ZIZPA|nr:hypothetical protein GUJ93_ZPchr0010g10678 [Zizania palustris]